MKVLITGGAGFIGSTIASCCADNGIAPVILDDYSRGLRVFAARHDHYEGDIADARVIEQIFADHPDIEDVVHCAAKIVVPESVAKPLDYYDNNVGKSIVLLRELARHGVKRFILSSTASMYGSSDDYMVEESAAIDPQSPYAASKALFERIMSDFAATGQMQCLALRYFNPIGADPQMRTGLQDPNPTHVLGKMIEAHKANGEFTVTGVDWPTRDGSGLRDYVHVWDLARAHVAALQRFDGIMSEAAKEAESNSGSLLNANYNIINLGTGTGTTVFELVDAFGKATGQPLKFKTAEARMGDVVGSATLTGKAERLLDWKAELSIADGVRDSLKWSEKLPSVLEEESQTATAGS